MAESPVATSGRERSPWAVVAAGLVVGALSGLALGVLWWKLAPRVPLVVEQGGAYPSDFQPEGYLASDVAFGILSLIAGIAIAIGLARMRREHLASVLIASMVAAAVGTAAMWWVGTHLGSVDIAGLAATETTVVVDAPLQVSLAAMYLVWALASATVVTVLALADWLSESRPSR